MARKVENEEERIRRIILVGQYLEKTGESTRKIAKHFTETYFNISNCTVSDYCHRYMTMRPEEIDIIRGKIDDNKEKTVNDPEVHKRVLNNAELYRSGMTIEEISLATGIDFWVIYRDLKRRLPLIDASLYESEIKPLLIENSSGNISKKR